MAKIFEKSQQIRECCAIITECQKFCITSDIIQLGHAKDLELVRKCIKGTSAQYTQSITVSSYWPTLNFELFNTVIKF